MTGDFRDLYELAREAGRRPLWFDESGAPRFAEHHPTLCPNIYADEVVLLLISCQGCGAEFPVQMSWSSSGVMARAAGSLSWLGIKLPIGEGFTEKLEATALSARIKKGSIHYGDPPNIGCCPAGPTMNCWDLKVLEFWTRRDARRDWARLAELELELPDLRDPERTDRV